MKSIVLLLVCMVAIASAATFNNNAASDMPELTKEQRLCIVNQFNADDTVKTALKKCHADDGGLECIKAIPQLANCFK